MKGIKKLLLILMLVIPFVSVDAACINSDGTGKKGSVSLSASSLSVYVDKKTTFKISAPCSAGRVVITSSDSSIATVSPSNDQFVDDSSITVSVKGKKAGKVTINVELKDVADYAGNVLSGTKKVTVNVKTPPTTTTKAASDKPTTTKTTKKTTTTKVVKEIKVNKFNIVGYGISFDPNVLEYTIEVAPNVNNLYIDVKGENFTATGDKEVNIEGKDSVVVSLKNGDKVQNYTIKINRTAATTVEPEIKEVVKEVVKTNNTFLYTTIALAIVCAVLAGLLIKGKKKVVETPPTYSRVEPPRTITPIQTTYINSVNTPTTTSSPQTVTNTQTSVVNPVESLDIQPTNNTVNPNSNNLQ